MVEETYTVRSIDKQPLIKLITSMIKIEKKSCLGLWELNKEDIIEKVTEKTGLTDLGNKNYLETLDKFLKNAENIELTPLAQYFLNFIGRKTATNRLHIEEYIKQHPEVTDVEIKKPIFIAGFPRTGTTLLQNTLSAGAGYRALHLWELATPYPLHQNPSIDKRKRISKVQLPLTLFRLRLPDFTTVHDVRVDSKEECWMLLANTLTVLHLDLGTGLTKWNTWLQKTDRTWAYEEYKRMLQIQAHIRPTQQFVLKCPTHLWNLPYLLKIFPDAHIVWTHRNPINSISSISSIAALARKFFFDEFDEKQIGTMVQTRNKEIITEVMKFRDKAGDTPFYDMNFESLVKDIPGSISVIRNHFDLPNTKKHQQAVQDFLNQPRDDKPGKHKYSPQQFGLQPSDIIEDFKVYIDRFNIKV